MATEISAERRAALDALIRKLQARANLPLGILGGLAGALIGAAVWAAVTFYTHFQIGYFAVGMGFVVGYGVRTAGGGAAKAFGVAGAILSLLGCALGNLGAAVADVATSNHLAFFDVAARLDASSAFDLLRQGFDAMDVLFYGIAVYFGYRYSLRRITPNEMAGLPK